jgi:hypothetical protein
MKNPFDIESAYSQPENKGKDARTLLEQNLRAYREEIVQAIQSDTETLTKNLDQRFIQEVEKRFGVLFRELQSVKSDYLDEERVKQVVDRIKKAIFTLIHNQLLRKIGSLLTKKSLVKQPVISMTSVF